MLSKLLGRLLGGCHSHAPEDIPTKITRGSEELCVEDLLQQMLARGRRLLMSAIFVSSSVKWVSWLAENCMSSQAYLLACASSAAVDLLQCFLKFLVALQDLTALHLVHATVTIIGAAVLDPGEDHASFSADPSRLHVVDFATPCRMAAHLLVARQNAVLRGHKRLTSSGNIMADNILRYWRVATAVWE